MTGFAHLTGQPDGPPTLPPFGLADGVAGIDRGVRGDDRAARTATTATARRAR